MAATPWMKFYPQDWRADEKLRMCSLAARGLWIEMLAIMHRSERYGQLLIGGRVPTDAQLAVQAGTSPSEVTALLAELDGAGVFSRAGSGAIYSRRMTRDHKKAENARKNGKNGGNPCLMLNSGKDDVISASVKGSDNGGLKGEVKAQKPEARDQKGRTPIAPKPTAGLPDWIPQQEWGGFVAMRVKIKKPLTDRAISMIVRKLDELRTAGHLPAQVLDQSTMHCWQDVYELKADNRGQTVNDEEAFYATLGRFK